jgi:hypothetical protein
MRKADAAERILSLTTTPENTASIVGDLMEQADLHGTLWFWASLLRTTTALGWRTFAQVPGQVIWLAFYGTVVQTAYFLVVMLSFAIGTAGLFIGAMALGVNAEWMQMQEAGIYLVVFYLVMFEMLFSFVVMSILYGKWLARKAPHRELAVYVVFWILFVAPFVAIPLILPSTTMFGLGLDMLLNALTTVLGTIFTFVGIERARKQNAIRPTSAF